MRKIIITSIISAAIVVAGALAVTRPSSEAAPRCDGPNPPVKCPTATPSATQTATSTDTATLAPTLTPTPTATATDTPAPEPFSVTFNGPTQAHIDTLIAYTITLYNRGPAPAAASIDAFLRGDQTEFIVGCIYWGVSPSTAPVGTGVGGPCVDITQFQYSGTNGAIVTLAPGETLWATFTGYFSAVWPAPPLIQAIWHYDGNGRTAGAYAQIHTQTIVNE